MEKQDEVVTENSPKLRNHLLLMFLSRGFFWRGRELWLRLIKYYYKWSSFFHSGSPWKKPHLSQKGAISHFDHHISILSFAFKSNFKRNRFSTSNINIPYFKIKPLFTHTTSTIMAQQQRKRSLIMTGTICTRCWWDEQGNCFMHYL